MPAPTASCSRAGRSSKAASAAAGVQQHRVAHRPLLAREHAAEHVGVERRRAAAQGVGRPTPGCRAPTGRAGRARPRRRGPPTPTTSSRWSARRGRRPHGRPARAPPRAASTPAMTGAMRGSAQPIAGGHRPGRVGQRAEEVEDRGDAHLAPRAAGEAACRGGTPARRRSRCRPPARSAPRRPPGGRWRPRAPRARRRPRRTTTRPGRRAWRPAPPRRRRPRRPSSEMLTVCAPSPPVPTMSTQATGISHRRRLGQHLGRQTGDLLGRLPLGAQRDREGRDLHRGRLAGHHLAHRPRGVGGGEVAARPAAG